METINHECYVDLEVAKLLKESGFDWKCNGTFISEDGIQYAFIKMDAACDSNNSKYNPYNISAPTIELAQRWLREVKGLLLGMNVHDNSVHYAWEYTISRIDYLNLDGRGLSLIHWLCDNYDETENIIHHGKRFIPYEEVLEAGIKAALEIILEKEE